MGQGTVRPDCGGCGDRTGDVYVLRVSKLSGETFTVSPVFCESCAQKFLATDWVEVAADAP